MIGSHVKVKRAGAPPPALFYKEERARSAEYRIAHIARPGSTPAPCEPYAKPPESERRAHAARPGVLLVAARYDLCYSTNLKCSIRDWKFHA